MTNRDRLIRLATALYGDRWQRALARDIGEHQAQVSRWALASQPPDRVVAEVERLAAEKVKLISKLLKG